MKISVVIPVYNVEEYLRECLDSVVNQTYKDLEILLIDDGSTDSSGEICEEYALKDDRISVYHKPNGGLSDARNVGINHATGEYIYLLDSDDYLSSKEALESLAIVVHTDTPDIIIGCYVELVNNKLVQHVKEKDDIQVLTPQEAIRNIYRKEYKSIFTVAHNKLYKTRLLQEFPYPKGKLHEDEFITYKLYLASQNILFVSKNTYVYRIRQNSIMSSHYTLKRLDAIEALQERFSDERLDDKLRRYTLDSLLSTLNLNVNQLFLNGFHSHYLHFYTVYKDYLKTYYSQLFFKHKIKQLIKFWILKGKTLKGH